MAAIMTAHMTNTASQFAADQSDIGIVSCAAGLSILLAPQNRTNQHTSVTAQRPVAVQRRATIRSRDDADKSTSALIGERGEEAVSARDVARDPVVVDLETRGTGDGGRVSRRNRERMAGDFDGSAALSLNRLNLG
jgi:hypothetical protein